ncbi:hypothetical protein FCV25MIE_24921 [Fagus crenata]
MCYTTTVGRSTVSATWASSHMNSEASQQVVSVSSSSTRWGVPTPTHIRSFGGIFVSNSQEIHPKPAQSAALPPNSYSSKAPMEIEYTNPKWTQSKANRRRLLNMTIKSLKEEDDDC